jgi:hypothetical protein
MYVIKVDKYTVSHVNENGVLSYAGRDGRVPKLFTSPEEAAAWWDKNAPTLPGIGDSDSVRCVPAEATPPHR